MANEAKLLALAKEHLDSDEGPLISAFGAYETKIMGNDSVRNGVLIATQRRVVFYAKKLGGHQVESFAYKTISSFESGKTMMGGTIAFYASGNRVDLKWIVPATSASNFVAVVRARMNDSSAPTAPASPPMSSAGTDVIGLIQQLASLRDAGVLSEEEFVAKKAQLLAQI